MQSFLVNIMQCVQIFVTGRVQGVFFRVYTRDFARKLSDVTGYVKNLRDGRVEILAEGSNESLQKLAQWAKEKGSPGSTITKTEEIWEDITERRFQNFQITF
jgi:acylphosphatase